MRAAPPMIDFRFHSASTRVASRFASSLVLAMALAGWAPAALAQKPESGAVSTPARILWQDPGDIRSRDLYWGPGGQKHAPQGPVTFIKEDKNGHNPKFDVEDADGKKWRLKPGPEAQPEVVA